MMKLFQILTLQKTLIVVADVKTEDKTKDVLKFQLNSKF